MNDDDIPIMVTRVHNVRAQFLKRVNDGVTLAENHDVEGASEEFAKDIKLVKELERIQKFESTHLKNLKKIINREIHDEDRLARALAHYVQTALSKDDHDAIRAVWSVLQDVEEDFKREDAELEAETRGLIG